MLPIIKIRLLDSQEHVQGYLVGTSLVIFSDNGYWILANRPGDILLRNIQTLNDAEQLATTLDQIYSDYFPLWCQFPRMNIFQVCKWSVPDGCRWCETMELLQGYSTITMKLVQNVFQKSTGSKFFWNYMLSSQEFET